MRYISEDIVFEAIKAQLTYFSSHNIIDLIHEKFPQAYAQELGEYVRHDDPIRALHAAIAIYLKSAVFSLNELGDIETINMRRNYRSNKLWQKHLP